MEIGNLYRKAGQSAITSAEYNLQVGQKLIAKKKSILPGKWNEWLLENKEVLGFETPRTAQRLMRAASKCDASVVFGNNKAAAFNRSIWHPVKEVDEDTEGADEGDEAAPRQRPPVPDYVDECVTAFKKTTQATIDKMRRGRASQGRFERLFAALTETLTDLQNETMPLTFAQLAQRERIAQREEAAEGMGAAS